MSRPTKTQTILASAALVAFAGYMLLWFAVKPRALAHSTTDFSCFYRAGSMVRAGQGHNVYDLTSEQEFDNALGTVSVDADGNRVSLPFVFAPFTLALFMPLATLPYHQAEFVWYSMNVGMLLALPAYLSKPLNPNTKGVVIALLTPLVFLPVILALLQGQPTILLLVLFTVAYGDLCRGQEARAGIWLGLAGFKPQLVLPMLLALIVWRRRRMLQAFVLTCGGLMVASIWIVGWQATLGYPRAVMQYANMEGRPGGEHPASMPNLRGCLYSALHARLTPLSLQQTTVAISLLLLAAMAFILWRQKHVSPYGFSLVVLVTLLTSYHAYLHDDSLLLLPCLIAGTEILCNGKPATQLLIATCIGLIFLVPLAPTSLSATAGQMALTILVFATLIAIQMLTEAPRVTTLVSGAQRRSAILGY